LEQRVGGNFHLVVVNPREILIEPYGIGVADEMDFVAARRQFQTELSSDDPAAAVGGVTGNADSHF
jgi:hypothetical protein